MTETFTAAVLAGKAHAGDIDDWIDAWHASAAAGTMHLHEYLGFTWNEYQAIAVWPLAIDAVLARRGLAADDPLAPVYEWLANDLGFPVDVCTLVKPAWVDVRGLAAAWHAKERGTGHGGSDVTVDDYVFWLLEETGWDAPEEGSTP